MNCAEARAALSGALDGDPESLVALRHGMLCQECAAFARALHHLDGELHDVLGEVEEAPAGFADRLMARLPDESPAVLHARERDGRGAEAAGWVVAVAALLGAADAGGLLGEGPRLVAWFEPLVREAWAALEAAGGTLDPWLAPTPWAPWMVLALALVLHLAAGRGMAGREV